MSKIMQTTGMNLPAKEIQGHRVVSYKQIAELHQVPIVNLQNNFKRNHKRFIYGTDYFKTQEHSPGTNKMLVSRIYFTESGYLMLVKSLSDDLSWEVQRMLVNSYFRANLLEQVLSFLPASTRKLIYYRALGLTQKETAKLLGLRRDQIQKAELKLKALGYKAPSQGGKRTTSFFVTRSHGRFLESEQMELSL